jgi:hypothetical protein
VVLGFEASEFVAFGAPVDAATAAVLAALGAGLENHHIQRKKKKNQNMSFLKNCYHNKNNNEISI